MALVPPIDASPEEIREWLLPIRRNFSVAVIAPGNAFAIGAIIRTAHSFLAREIFIVGTEPHYEKASMGMEKYETIVRLGEAQALFEATRGRPIVAFEREHASASLFDADLPDNAVLLFGSERFGLEASALARADQVLAIPMFGINNSFPVAVAAGIAMAEWARQNALASRLPARKCRV